MGRPPYYRPWVEVFNIRGSLGPNIASGFYAEGVEDAILDLMSETLKAGERFYIEYYNDWETARALELGVPSAATRLDYKLFVKRLHLPEGLVFPRGLHGGGPEASGREAPPEEGG